MMENKIAVAGADEKWCHELVAILEGEQFNISIASSLMELEQILSSDDYFVGIVDIDLLPITNQELRKLTLRYPEMNLLFISTDSFHPDMKDAIGSKIYACLKKPVDFDELLYFIRSIYKDLT